MRARTIGVSAVVAALFWVSVAPAASADDGSSAERAASAVDRAAAAVDLAVGAAGPTAFSSSRVEGRSVRLPAEDADISLLAGASAQQGANVVDGAARGGVPTYVAQTLADSSVRVAAVLQSSGEQILRFHITMPAEARMTVSPEGYVVVFEPVKSVTRGTDQVSGATVLGVFRPAWARDSRGKSIPTSYSIDGTTLVQRVSVPKDAAFPVVADPTWSMWFGHIVWSVWAPIFVWVYYNKNGTKDILSGQYWVASAVVGALALLTPCTIACAIFGIAAVLGAVFWNAAPDAGLCGYQEFDVLTRRVTSGAYRRSGWCS